MLDTQLTNYQKFSKLQRVPKRLHTPSQMRQYTKYSSEVRIGTIMLKVGDTVQLLNLRDCNSECFRFPKQTTRHFAFFPDFQPPKELVSDSATNSPIEIHTPPKIPPDIRPDKSDYFQVGSEDLPLFNSTDLIDEFTLFDDGCYYDDLNSFY